MDWLVSEETWDPTRIELNGSKYSIGNGYFGYRGTLEEFGPAQLCALTLAGLYDDSGSGWREPVNAPNPLYLLLEADGEGLNVFESPIISHTQALDLRAALHRRTTSFLTRLCKAVTLSTERFASAEDPKLLVSRITITCDQPLDLRVRTGIEGRIWDINGPHLTTGTAGEVEGFLYHRSRTVELGKGLVLVEGLNSSVEPRAALIDFEERSVLRVLDFRMEPDTPLLLEKTVALGVEEDSQADPFGPTLARCREAGARGYEKLLEGHQGVWEGRWDQCDVTIEGDPEAQRALRYSLYLLLGSAPFHSDGLSIPARGLSGQVYKGAFFWDTELYMLPFFNHEFPDLARNLVRYRLRNLEGARRKAREYGFRGAFYPWESQENGQEGCTHYNLADSFTGRPVRTYFRDKQIHISADVVYGIWEYYRQTGDKSILVEGGAETALECARFFLSWSYYKTDKGRYELLDVTGADEYHERVNNDAYTNAMVAFTLDAALRIVDLLAVEEPAFLEDLLGRLDFAEDLDRCEDLARRLYVPAPDSGSGLIEQFDGYFRLKDLRPQDLRAQVLVENEYWGSPTGLAVDTQVLKQADVVLLLALFRGTYPRRVKEANWRYYEERTEHGSSLSTCVYAWLAADLGLLDWAYTYFMKAATIDLSGAYRLYLGPLYIGGTHPAANGGSWIVAVQGFGGLDCREEEVRLSPHLPSHWTSLSFHFLWRGQACRVTVRHGTVVLRAEGKNAVPVRIGGTLVECPPGGECVLSYTEESDHDA